ncbi:MAG: hypothetical protein EP338_09585 [Bacteroidetes bacterium]|nr:MAG: hypothetical protein EP338_09585 [Bacteroidota bacterium]
MDRLLDFIERHKYGLLAVLLVYIASFVFFNLETYEKRYVVPIWDERAQLETPEVKINPENIDLQNFNASQGDVKSIAQDLNDERQKDHQNWDRDKAAKDAAQRIKDLEKEYFGQSGGEKEREEYRKELEKQRNDGQQKKDPNQQTANSGGNTAYEGQVMVNWQLSGREPHQNNSWYVRNPGYTCGKGANGTVCVRIKVDQGGSVRSASYVSEQSSGVNSCMRDQALKYAKLSRFNYSGSAPKQQEGYIYYRFVAQ